MDPVQTIANLHKPDATVLAQPEGQAIQDVWSQLTCFRPRDRHLRRQRIVADSHFDPTCHVFDVLRTKILRLLAQSRWKSIAVTSPTAQCGKSVVTLNLAFSLARAADIRVAVIELDLRRPNFRTILGMKSPLLVESFLRNTVSISEAFVRIGDSLAIAAAAGLPNSANLLDQPAARDAILKAQEVLKPDVILVDMPPLFANSDVLSFAKNVDCGLIVAAAGTTTLAEIESCEKELSHETNVLGIVLNKCQYSQRKTSYY
jgi:Mrp family chromosome partitioning ATPase